MNEDLIRQVTERVRREIEERPRALLIGKAPTGDTGFSYVGQGEYEAVLIGSMSPWELLQFPDENSLNALLEGKPVYFWEAGQDWKKWSKGASRSLYGRLLSAHRQMLQWGVKPLKAQDSETLITAQELRRRLRLGLPTEGRLTPLARDILEGRE